MSAAVGFGLAAVAWAIVASVAPSTPGRFYFMATDVCALCAIVAGLWFVG